MSRSTRTGGREATSARIEGIASLSIGKTEMPTPPGFRWVALADVARLESGHTPSRSRPDYWDGDIPWIGLTDVTSRQGQVIWETRQTVTQAGVDNSSTRLLPAGTVCLSRTASVGYVVQLGRPMCTSQDFVNWVCGPELHSTYLRYLILSEVETIRRIAYGTTHRTMYYPDAKAIHVLIPSIPRQRSIAAVLGALDDKIEAEREIERQAVQFALLTIGHAPVPLTALEQLATLARTASSVPSGDVDHYSLPAFDVDGLPARESSDAIKSNKQILTAPCVLLSKLNPRIPRAWDVVELDPTVPSVASTEFLVLTSDLPSGLVWAALASGETSARLQELARGTSGSHQRVAPADAMAMAVPDVRALHESQTALLVALSQRRWSAKQEIRRLATLRDALLPPLMSGRLSVREAEQQVEEVL